ncbi:hypothetical protein ASZ78_001060, partial [Callipepla squamata]
MISFLQMYGKDIRRDVPQILHMLQSCMLSLQQSTFMPFLSLAVVILIRHHPEAMLDSFLQQLEPRD